MLPQLHPVDLIVPVLARQGGVIAVWLGGSLARGDGDEFSDVDLRVAVTPNSLEAWRKPDMDALWNGQCIACQTIQFGDRTVLHHLILASGEIVDLLVQSEEEPIHDSSLRLLFCRDTAFARRLEAPVQDEVIHYPEADGDTVRQAVEGYWINSHKHRKVLHRELELVALAGVQLERSVLLRLWYIHATGRDCGPPDRQAIYGLTRITGSVSHARGLHALAVLGADLSSRQAICRAIEQVRDEVSGMGRDLAARLNFDYPERLEQLVRRAWAEFR